MKKSRMILLISAILALIVIEPSILAADQAVSTDYKVNISSEIVRGKVVEIASEQKVKDPLDGDPTVNQELRVLITSGGYKGKILTVLNNGTSNPVFNIQIHSGDRVLVALERQKDGTVSSAYIADHLRTPQISLLIVIFIVAILAVGWRCGAKAIAALLLTMVLIWGALLPGILRGYNPIILTIVISALATGITIIIVGGWSLKSLAAILGTVGGVALSGILVLIIGKAAYLTGFGSEESAMLLYIPQNITLDVQGLLFAGIIIGALGAAMDVSVSVASAITEIKRVNPQLERIDLINSGMNVGRDIIGTMANTLILAYTGNSLQLILIFMAYRESFLKVINLDMVASEIVRALVGSIGLVLVVPFTAIVSGWLLSRPGKC